MSLTRVREWHFIIRTIYYYYYHHYLYVFIYTACIYIYCIYTACKNLSWGWFRFICCSQPQHAQQWNSWWIFHRFLSTVVTEKVKKIFLLICFCCIIWNTFSWFSFSLLLSHSLSFTHSLFLSPFLCFCLCVCLSLSKTLSLSQCICPLCVCVVFQGIVIVTPTVFCVCQFCQPTGYSLSTQQQQPAFYVAVLTDVDADRHYCATFTFHETVAMTPSKPDDVDADDHDATLIHHSLMYAPKSLVLVSRLDYFEAFRVGNPCMGDFSGLVISHFYVDKRVLDVLHVIVV